MVESTTKRESLPQGNQEESKGSHAQNQPEESKRPVYSQHETSAFQGEVEHQREVPSSLLLEICEV